MFQILFKKKRLLVVLGEVVVIGLVVVELLIVVDGLVVVFVVEVGPSVGLLDCTFGYKTNEAMLHKFLLRAILIYPSSPNNFI